MNRKYPLFSLKKGCVALEIKIQDLEQMMLMFTAITFITQGWEVCISDAGRLQPDYESGALFD